MVTSKRDHVTDNRILRYCSSVLSSSLTEASPSGHCERVVTASHASVAESSATACSILRPNHRLAPARFYSDHSPPLRCLNHVVDRTTHRDRYSPATTEAPALVPELHPLVHVVGRFYPSDRSGVFRSPDLSQFPEFAVTCETDFPLRRQKIGVTTSDNPSELRTAFHGLAPSPSRFTDKPSHTC